MQVATNHFHLDATLSRQYVTSTPLTTSCRCWESRHCMAPAFERETSETRQLRELGVVDSKLSATATRTANLMPSVLG